MSGVVTPGPLLDELLAWISDVPRSYGELVDAWVSNCPRHPVWDDAVAAGLVVAADGSVQLTAKGQALLEERRR